MIDCFDWDKGNREKNWAKHEVDFRECEEVFFNRPLKIFPDKTHSQIEERYVAYGKTVKIRRLTIVFTVRNNKIRVISARDMHKKEKEIYDQN